MTISAGMDSNGFPLLEEELALFHPAYKQRADAVYFFFGINMPFD